MQLLGLTIERREPLQVALVDDDLYRPLGERSFPFRPCAGDRLYWDVDGTSVLLEVVRVAFGFGDYRPSVFVHTVEKEEIS